MPLNKETKPKHLADQRRRDGEMPTDYSLLNHRSDPIYPTPPLGQEMTQGHFLSGV